MILVCSMLLHLIINPSPIYTFSPGSPRTDWRVVDDVVMGGRSSGSFHVDQEGYGVFTGTVSLENNGGFSSVRHNPTGVIVGSHQNIVFRLKGDGRKYQFRLKANQDDYYSYVHSFTTTGEWQQITLPLADFYPSFRGRTLDIPHFDQKTISEIAFLIANKKKESFELKIKSMELQ